MTEDLLRRLYQIKKEKGYLTRNEIIKKDYEWEMKCLNEATEETYHYIWKEIMEKFMRTKTDVKREFQIYNLSEYPFRHKEGNYQKRYYDYEKLSDVYNKHICLIKLKKYNYFFSLEDLMEKLIEDGFKADYRVVTKYAILSLALSVNKIDKYLDEATHFMALKRRFRII